MEVGHILPSCELSHIPYHPALKWVDEFPFPKVEHVPRRLSINDTNSLTKNPLTRFVVGQLNENQLDQQIRACLVNHDDSHFGFGIRCWCNFLLAEFFFSKCWATKWTTIFFSKYETKVLRSFMMFKSTTKFAMLTRYTPKKGRTSILQMWLWCFDI